MPIPGGQLQQEPLDWNKLGNLNRVWMSDDGSDPKVRLEFLAQHGLRLILADIDARGAGSLHFSNPVDCETLHIKSPRGQELLLTASEYFPETSRWLQLLGIEGGPIINQEAGESCFEDHGNLLITRGGRLCGLYEAAREWPGEVLAKKPVQGLESLAGNGSAHGMARMLAFLQAVEEARGLSVPATAIVLRAVLLELERVYSHLSWLSEACDVFGRAGLAGRCQDVSEKLARAVEPWLGDAEGGGWLIPGGLREELVLGDAQAISESLMPILAEWKRMEGKALALPTPGWLSRKLVSLPLKPRAEGWVGPLARAADLATDARAEEAGPYQVLGWSPTRARRRKGIFGKVLEIRVLEVTSSLEMLMRLLAQLPGGPLLKKRGGRAKAEGFGRVEGPQGEICCHISLEKGLVRTAVFSFPADFNRSIAGVFSGAWLDEVEPGSFLWR